MQKNKDVRRKEKHEEAIDELALDFDAKVEAATILIVNEPLTPPPLLWGGIGVGKTTFCENLAHKLDMPFYQLPASHIDPALLHGIPTANIEEKITSFFPPEFFAHSRTFLLIDEVNTAPESVIASIMEAIRSRRIGSKVYEDLRVVLAANPTRLAAGGFSLPLPLKNRVVHIDWDLPLSYFRAVTALPPFDRKKVTEKAPIPLAPEEEVRRRWARASGLVDAFLERFPHFYYEEEVIEEGAGRGEDVRAFGTPRTWDYVKVILAVFESVGASPAATALAILGTVGRAGYDFLAFLSNQNVPQPMEILTNPQHILALPADVLYSSIFALVSFVAQNPDDEIVDKFFDVAAALIEAKKHDYAILLLDSLVSLLKAGHKIYFPLVSLQKLDMKVLMRARELINQITGGMKGG